ncbi:Mpped1 [Symbiodinium necroappetens]|uniref:Mpped1 protein n=1 Tax=Symbiodinium necroappetens TaxID=1628268 RepID=A0A813BJ30_9DINO|nr:Mpped1 [Symbiodinium necroappetens]
MACGGRFWVDLAKGSYRKLRHINYDFLSQWSWLHKLFTACFNWFRAGCVLYVDVDAGEWKYTTESALRKPGPNTTRLAVVSDTHLYHRQVWIPAGDVLIHAGDCLAEWGNGVKELEDFAAWLHALPHREKLVTGGNHDKAFEDLGPERMAQILAPCGVRYLHPDLCASRDAGGLVVAGCPWSIRVNPMSVNRAFQPTADDERLSIPPPHCDVLVTHGPSMASPVWHANVRDRRPRLHLFGHEHDKYGVNFEDGMVQVNAALCNDFFCAVRRPVVVDILRSRQ